MVYCSPCRLDDRFGRRRVLFAPSSEETFTTGSEAVAATPRRRPSTVDGPRPPVTAPLSPPCRGIGPVQRRPVAITIEGRHVVVLELLRLFNHRPCRPRRSHQQDTGVQLLLLPRYLRRRTRSDLVEVLLYLFGARAAPRPPLAAQLGALCGGWPGLPQRVLRSCASNTLLLSALNVLTKIT